MIAWSYSRLSDFENCRLLFKNKYITKTIKFVPNAATDRGADIHDKLERNVTKAKYKKPQTFLEEGPISNAAPLIDWFVGNHRILFIEQQLAFTEGMQPTGYFDKNVWLRCVVDLAGIFGPDGTPQSLTIFDWKTGQYRPNDDQVTLYNVCGMAHWPYTTHSTSTLIFVDHKKNSKPVTTKRADMDYVMEGYRERVEEMQIAVKRGIFDPSPCFHCGWCGVMDCRFNRSK